MKIVIIEPLGVEESALMKMASEALGTEAEIVYYNTRTTDTEELIKRGQDADIIALGNLPFGREVMEGCRCLKMLAVAFTGVDHVDMGYCREKGIMVCNCAGYSNTAVSELVFGSVLSLYRNIIQCDKALRKGGTKDGLVGFELEGKTMGVVGTGAIGQRVIRLAQAFGMKVIAYSRTPGKVGEIPYMSLEQVMAQSDIVSLHVPLNETTRGMIGAREISCMKKTAVLVNTARGPVVDGAALAKALKEGRIAGAAIDVFDTEPPVSSENPLLQAPNTVLTPHVAFATSESMVKRARIEFDNIAAYMKGNPRNIVH